MVATIDEDTPDPLGCAATSQRTAADEGSQNTPYAAVDYGYDGTGDNTVEEWSLNLPETGSQRFNIERDFGPGGLLHAANALWRERGH